MLRCSHCFKKEEKSLLLYSVIETQFLCVFVVEKNLLFNFVRETSDHGNINTWDRLPFLTKCRDGVNPSYFPKETVFAQNLLFNDYNSVWPLDNDDGACLDSAINCIVALSHYI